MTLSSAHSSATLRTINLASESGNATLLSPGNTATLRTMSVASEPGSATLLSPSQFGIGGATLRTVGVAPAQFSSVQYVNGAVGAMNGTALHGNMRYLVPVQRASESYVMVNQAPQMLTPVYMQNVQNVQSLQRLSVSSLEETDSVQQVVSDSSFTLFLRY